LGKGVSGLFTMANLTAWVRIKVGDRAIYRTTALRLRVRFNHSFF